MKNKWFYLGNDEIIGDFYSIPHMSTFLYLKKNQKIKDLKNDYNIFHKIEKFSLLILNGKTRLQKL